MTIRKYLQSKNVLLTLLILDAKMKRVGIVSPKEIAKDQGKPLSKYERNMMIFDWLHTLGNNINHMMNSSNNLNLR